MGTATITRPSSQRLKPGAAAPRAKHSTHVSLSCSHSVHNTASAWSQHSHQLPVGVQQSSQGLSIFGHVPFATKSASRRNCAPLSWRRWLVVNEAAVCGTTGRNGRSARMVFVTRRSRSVFHAAACAVTSCSTVLKSFSVAMGSCLEAGAL